MDEIMNGGDRRAVKVERQGVMRSEEQIDMNLGQRFSERKQFRKGIFAIIMIDYPGKIGWEIQKFFITGAAEEGKPGIDI